jgi:hypothetical protein
MRTGYMAKLKDKLDEARRWLKRPELLRRKKDLTKLERASGDYQLDEIIQITQIVADRIRPPYADDADVLRALDKCGIRVDSLFAELDRRTCGDKYTDAELAGFIVNIILDKFHRSLLEVAGHKATWSPT